MYQNYAARRWRSVAPRNASSKTLGDVLICDGMSLVLPLHEILGGDPCRITEIPHAAYQPAARLTLLAASELAAELLFPTLGLFLEQHPDREYFHEFAWAYNRWLTSEWTGVAGLYPMIMLGGRDSARDKRAAITFATEHHMRGILLPSAPLTGCWASAEHGRFFSDAAEAGLLIAFHAFSRPVRPGVLRAAAAVFTAAHEAMDAVSELVLGGVLDAHRDLRVLFGEGQSWWIGEWLRRVTGTTEPGELPAWSNQIRVTDSTYPSVGGNLISWANDYPHGCGGGESYRIERLDVPDSYYDGAFWL